MPIDSGVELINNNLKISVEIAKKSSDIYEKPGRTVVGMYEGEIIKTSENTQNFELLTYGLGGCNVIAIEGICEDGTFGIITHYPPSDIKGNIKKLKELSREIGSKSSIQNVNTVLFVQGEWKETNNNFKFLPANDFDSEILSTAVKAIFGEKTNLKLFPYDLSVKEEWAENRSLGDENIKEIIKNIENAFNITHVSKNPIVEEPQQFVSPSEIDGTVIVDLKPDCSTSQRIKASL